MTLPARAQTLLEKAAAILPISDEDLIYKGIAVGVSERIMDLKKAEAQLQQTYGSLEALERKVKTEAISPDDHTMYTDLLEWRAIHHEQVELMRLFEDL
jgi:hypothetical protein